MNIYGFAENSIITCAPAHTYTHIYSRLAAETTNIRIFQQFSHITIHLTIKLRHKLQHIVYIEREKEYLFIKNSNESNVMNTNKNFHYACTLGKSNTSINLT